MHVAQSSADHPWRDFGIRAAAYVAPNAAVSVEDWAAETGLGADVAAHFRRAGNAYLYRAEGRSVEDLASEALARLIDEGDVRAEEVDILCVTATMSTSTLPAPESLAVTLARRFGFRNAVAFSLSQLSCSSLVGAIHFLCRYAKAKPEIRNVVIVTSDIMHGETHRDRHRTDIQSDGAAAIVISRDCERNRFGSILVEPLLGYHMGFDRVPALNARLRAMWPKKLADIIRRAVAASGRSIEGYVALLPLNASLATWRPYAQMFQRNEDFIFADNIGLKAHMCCADAVVNLVDGRFLDLNPARSVVAVTLGSTAVFAAFTLHGLDGGARQLAD
jgi:hypothetical protein